MLKSLVTFFFPPSLQHEEVVGINRDHPYVYQELSVTML